MLNIFAEALLLATRLDRPGVTDHRLRPPAEFHDEEARRLPAQPRTNGR